MALQQLCMINVVLARAHGRLKKKFQVLYMDFLNTPCSLWVKCWRIGMRREACYERREEVSNGFIAIPAISAGGVVIKTF